MEPNEKDYVEIDLAEIFRILVNNARNIFFVAACCMLLATVYLMANPPAPQAPEKKEPPWPVYYRSTATLRIKAASNMANFNLAQKCATYANLLGSDAFCSPIREQLKITSRGKGGGAPIKDTEMMTISFDADKPEMAQKGNELLVQSLRNYIARTEQIELPYTAGGNGGTLFQRVECEIINPPNLPTSPVPKPKPKEDKNDNKKPAPPSPETTRNRTLAVSAFLGILLGSGYAVMYALMNRKITTAQDVEDYLGLPVLGVIPDEASLQEALARQEKKSVWQRVRNILLKWNT